MSHLIKASFQSKANYRLALLSEAAGPLLRLGARLRASSPPTPPEAWRNGLLIGADHIGDVLFRSGSLPDLAAALPDCRWTFAAGRPADELLETDPHVARVLRLDREVARLGWAGLLRALRSEAFDVVVCYDSGSYWKILAAAAWAGIPNRVAYVHKGFSSLATFPVPFSGPAPHARLFRDLVARIVGRSLDHEARPRVHPTADDEAAASAAFASLRVSPGRAVVACAMLTRQAFAAYPPEAFLRTLRKANEGAALHVVFLGSAGEKARLEEIAAGSGLEYTVLAGGLGLRALACFLGKCRAALVADSGVRHLAAAANLPAVFVRNLHAEAVGTGRYCEGEYDASSHPGSMTREEMARAELSFDEEGAARKLAELALRPAI